MLLEPKRNEFLERHCQWPDLHFRRHVYTYAHEGIAISLGKNRVTSLSHSPPAFRNFKNLDRSDFSKDSRRKSGRWKSAADDNGKVKPILASSIEREPASRKWLALKIFERSFWKTIRFRNSFRNRNSKNLTVTALYSYLFLFLEQSLPSSLPRRSLPTRRRSVSMIRRHVRKISS